MRTSSLQLVSIRENFIGMVQQRPIKNDGQRDPTTAGSRFSKRVLAAGLGSAIGLSLLAGCGSNSDRLAVSGKVTFDGAPLDSGSIRFTSTGDQKLTVSGALIKDGEYNITEEKGLLPGGYRVQITSPDLNAPPVMSPPTPSGPSFAVAPERIPPEYNVNSKLSVDVAADGDNHFEFDILRQAKK